MEVNHATKDELSKMVEEEFPEDDGASGDGWSSSEYTSDSDQSQETLVEKPVCEQNSNNKDDMYPPAPNCSPRSSSKYFQYVHF